MRIVRPRNADPITRGEVELRVLLVGRILHVMHIRRGGFDGEHRWVLIAHIFLICYTPWGFGRVRCMDQSAPTHRHRGAARGLKR